MKRLMKSLVLMAAAAVALASCAKENVSELNNGGQKFAEVSFNAEIPAYQTTKSTIDVDGIKFNTRWAEGDQMGMTYSYGETGSKTEKENVPAKYTKDGSYTVILPTEYTGTWEYYVYYPYQSAMSSSKYIEIPFGAERTQTGDAINPAYDIMHGIHGVNNAAAGKEEDGSSIHFEMERLTSLLYFHFTSSLKEKVLKATLSVDGDPIAADKYVMHVDMTNSTTSYTTGQTYNEITLNLTDATANDFFLWFNILPHDDTYRDNGIENIKLVVETETKTFSITNPNTDVDIYEAGQIHSINAIVPESAWKDKTTPTPPAAKAYYEKVTTAPTDWSGDYLIVYEAGSVAFDGSLSADKIDSGNNVKQINIKSNKVEATAETDNISFNITTFGSGYSIQSASGDYIGMTKYDNGLERSTSGIVNTISFDNNTITISGIKNTQGTSTLRFNSSSGTTNYRFRYYKSGQKPIALYKRSEDIARPSLTVTAPESLLLTAQGGTTEAFTVATNQESWNAVSDNEAFTVSKTGNSFTVSTTVNPTFSARTATITVSAGSAKSQTFTITQSAATFRFYQSGSEEVVLKAAKGDTKQITIVSDYDWEAVIPANAKFSVTPSEFTYADADAATSGTTKRQAVVFQALEDNASEEGTLTLGTVIFSNKQNDAKLTVTVKQESSYVAPFITLSPESTEVSADITTASFEVESNVAWTVSTEATWLTKYTESGTGDGKVEITFPANTANTASTARTADFIVTSTDGKLSKTFKLTQKAAGATAITDVLTADDFKATSTGYTEFSNVTKTSKAVYTGLSAKSEAGSIQLRSKQSNSGIVTTTSGGTVKSVKISIEKGSSTINVYGSNTAYTSASDLYDSTKQGTKIGSTSKTGTITISGSYNYIGIRSNSGAVYISSIEIVWE